MRTLWCDDESEYDGEFYTLPKTRQFPKPIQKPHPPIHFGGESDAALRRVADLGQGWYGFNLEADQVAERVKRLETFLERKGRRREDVQISVCPYMRPATDDLIRAYRDAGVDRVILVAAAQVAEGPVTTRDQLATTIGADAGPPGVMVMQSLPSVSLRPHATNVSNARDGKVSIKERLGGPSLPKGCW